MLGVTGTHGRPGRCIAISGVSACRRRAAPYRRTGIGRPAPGGKILQAVGRDRRRAGRLPRGRPRGRRLLPRPLEPRQGGPLDARRELHRVLLLEGVRQGRHHHLGDPADRLPVRRPRPSRVRARAAARAAPPSPGTPTRPPECATPTCAASCSRCTARRKARLGDPVLAWAEVTGDPEKRRRYQQARGKGGLVRASWAEAVEIAAAAHVHTIKTYGPDRAPGSRRSPRCRWCRTASAPGSSSSSAA